MRLDTIRLRERFDERLIAGALVVTLALVAAGCAGGSKVEAEADAATKIVTVKLTDGGCPASLQLPAGPTTFAVSNVGADAVSEFEILAGKTILGEIENLAPGQSGVFSLTLKPGSYRTYCPGGTRTVHGKLAVAGGATKRASVTEQRAVADYRRYVEGQTLLLVRRTRAFVAAMQAGNLRLAKQRYAQARVPYERIEPVAESFGVLDPAIDARAGDVPQKSWTGFHPIERILWVRGTTSGTRALALKLLHDVRTLQARVKTVKLEPAQIANGSVELLNEVSKSKITGEEERYSRLDLVDFQANLDGSRHAFESVQPLMPAADAQLAAQIASRFDALDAALAKHRRGATFVSYDDLTRADTRKLSQTLDALAEPLSRVGAIVVAAR
jgi:iron uptake system component EfeO